MNNTESNWEGGVMARLRRLLAGPSGERGSVLVITSFAVVGLLGMVALAVDLGMIYTARTEAQRAADSGALAGAQKWVATHGDRDATKAEAIDYAERHLVHNKSIDVSQSDVEIDESQDRVRVWVAQDVETIFARVIGIDVVRVKTKAAAEVVPAGAGKCPLPIAVVDRWNDLDSDGKYDSDEPYVPCPGTGCTSYSDPDDRGLLLEIKSQESEGSGQDGDGGSSSVHKTCEAVDSPSWECWFYTDPSNSGGSGGSNILRQRVDGCTDPPQTVALGQTLYSASGTGNKQDVVRRIKDYIDRNDPNAQWDSDGGDGHGCVTRPNLTGCADGSPRLRLVPLVDPSSVSGSGSNTTATTSSLASVFLEKVASGPNQPHGGGPSGQWKVYVRFAGAGGGQPGGDFEDSLAKAIVLVE